MDRKGIRAMDCAALPLVITTCTHGGTVQSFHPCTGRIPTSEQVQSSPRQNVTSCSHPMPTLCRKMTTTPRCSPMCATSGVSVPLVAECGHAESPWDVTWDEDRGERHMFPLDVMRDAVIG